MTADDEIRQSDQMLMRAELLSSQSAAATATALPVTPSPTAAPVTSTPIVPTPTPAMDARVEAYLAGTGMSRETFAERVQDAWWRQRLEQDAIAAVPASQSQVHARHILIATEEDAALGQGTPGGRRGLCRACGGNVIGSQRERKRVATWVGSPRAS